MQRTELEIVYITEQPDSGEHGRVSVHEKQRVINAIWCKNSSNTGVRNPQLLGRFFNEGRLMENKKPTIEESSRLLIAMSVSLGISLLSLGGFILLLSKAGCF